MCRALILVSPWMTRIQTRKTVDTVQVMISKLDLGTFLCLSQYTALMEQCVMYYAMLQVCGTLRLCTQKEFH